ncbi:helix-turn-helix domain-containing protein [Pseudovibrio sp. WM33]|uniref:helix-turn-helix domain-containing protein n=1 Tax=Pseudovibrio sp. WM33 TaxID=1735585 RepID=UPI0007B2D0F3|nr:helix-turn-helix transcriptional regulator [Pseudovibrio sp. WM33]KZL17604.1 helix-turn-helix protein [Pseudovibrio sp. WM33]
MAEISIDIQNLVLKELLIDARTKAQLTQKQISERIGKPQSYVSKYESGERKLSLPEIREIVICCGGTLYELITNYENELKLQIND